MISDEGFLFRVRIIVVIIGIAAAAFFVATIIAVISDSKAPSIFERKGPYKYNGTSCRNGHTLNCGMVLYDCDDGRDYACAQGVQVQK